MTMAVMQRLTGIALVLVLATPAFAQTKKNEHWVATWATALVSRPQPAAGRGLGPGGPPPPAPATQPAPSGSLAPNGLAPTAPPAGPPGGGRGGFAPPVTMSNQTI